jgi:hypothetical protein
LTSKKEDMLEENVASINTIDRGCGQTQRNFES